MIFRELRKEEIKNVWGINRGEYVDSTYVMVDGELVEKPLNIDFSGWPPNEDKIYQPILEACFDRGGYFLGVFDNEKMIAVVVLDSKPIGRDKNQLQFKFLHVDRSYRKKGLGRILFEKAAEEAKRRGFEKLYISSCETKNTVEFYKHLGCKITDDINKELFELEPEDIHMEYVIS